MYYKPFNKNYPFYDFAIKSDTKLTALFTYLAGILAQYLVVLAHHIW